MTTYAAEMASLQGFGFPPNSPSGSAGQDVPSGAGRPAATTRALRSPRVLQVRAAGFGRRLLAAIVDSVLVTALAVSVTAGAAIALGVPLPSAREFGPDFVLAGLLDRNPLAVGAFGLLAGLSALYQVYLGGMVGQTVGKRLFGLRVISGRGTCPGPLVGILRFIMLVVSLLPAGLGWTWCLFDRERRALHDHLSGTYVILEER